MKILIVSIFVILIAMCIYLIFLAINDDFDFSKSVKIIEIDSCEYVQVGVSYDRSLAHKGNCKFCAERENAKSIIKIPTTRIGIKPEKMEETGSSNFVIEDTTENESFWIGSRDKIKTTGKYATGF